ncbi:hypothetical protein BOTBODRAFT_134068 [Botryobasidium botryosum FD-172 SS1]|uniref:GYF domain-containing protein n=1 Tax=Botryobasidium botryosum (strain FD-172 SS1) TaxID=930990 RepID=A0A067MLZ7_BOTB1|nr:hypothetical protein BOTBODRAFT_134068 [Botryobasidium botryosum FD-172 SS1]
MPASGALSSMPGTFSPSAYLGLDTDIEELELYHEATQGRASSSGAQYIAAVDSEVDDKDADEEHHITHIVVSDNNHPSPLPEVRITASSSGPSLPPPSPSLSPPPSPMPIHSPPHTPLEAGDRSSLSLPRAHGSRSETPSPTPPLEGRGRRSRIRRRSLALDSHANRLSGFFSQLLHLNREPNSSRTTPTPVYPSTSTTTPAVIPPVLPPPSLPAPTLAELGLSLEDLSAGSSCSHFTTPPTQGTFLHPHYLLLCHAQGLDVLPLVSPPVMHPYALVRRVPFKSVLVMEERGVMVAIAGRRDGVRVYALEEVKRAVEWRMEVEIQRELERQRKQMKRKSAPSTRGATELDVKGKGKAVNGTIFNVTLPPIPDPPPQPIHVNPVTPPPTYATLSPPPPTRPRPIPTVSALTVSRSLRARASSVSMAMGKPINVIHGREAGEKGDWAGSDDDVLIAAGPSGSAALEERTSPMAAAAAASALQPLRSSSIQADMEEFGVSPQSPTLARSPSAAHVPVINRRQRPANLSPAALFPSVVPEESVSPTAPTLEALCQTLSRSTQHPTSQGHESPTDEMISFEQALAESRLPMSPPPLPRSLIPSRPSADNRRRSMSHPPPISEGYEMIDAQTRDDPSSAFVRSLGRADTRNGASGMSADARRKQRRWSILDGIFSNGTSATSPGSPPFLPPAPPVDILPSEPLASQSNPHLPLDAGPTMRPGGIARLRRPSSSPSPLTSVQENASPVPAMPRPASRFLPRILTSAFHSRSGSESRRAGEENKEDKGRKILGGIAGVAPHGPSHSQSVLNSPPPKLEYVKLPGTKNSLMIKSVETPKKSFLAILCGDNGEKVELFAGTYRTALGLSRTFILPDSPRNLELQLQGDDLVEIFLVFGHNIFGLEPATVRVREVRIGRAERRAARRRARELRSEDDPVDPAPAIGEDISHVITTVITTGGGRDTSPERSPGARRSNSTRQERRRSVAGQVRGRSGATSHENSPSPALRGEGAAGDATLAGTLALSEEMAAVAAAQLGPYTTFQQLSFVPSFPLATVADDYVIPPTYASYAEYRKEYEPEAGDPLAAPPPIHPPELPIPASSNTSTANCKWFYKDPKGVIQGPWKWSLMHSWFRDGFLPLDLPVRRDFETEYTLLKDLCAQSRDATSPFQPELAPGTAGASRAASPNPLHPPHSQAMAELPHDPKVLLSPISLLTQPKHYGPPALFFSTRGGHSTTIVDARGKSVLKSRVLWNADEADAGSPSTSKLGDVKRLEAFDVNNRAVLVALRQGGFEAADVGDAMLAPADASRLAFPQFHPASSAVNRRSTFLWRIGSSVSDANSRPSSNPTNASRNDATPNLVKAPTRREERSTSYESEDEFAPDQEIIFLARNGDEVYFCERGIGSFRILRLSPRSC